MYGLKVKNDPSQKNFLGHLSAHKQDNKFIYLKLHESEKQSSSNNDRLETRKPFPHLDSLKEFDLLLLSDTKLDTINVKQLTSSTFLKEIQGQKGKMMAIVVSKRKHDKTYMEIKVDIRHESYATAHLSEF